MFSQVFLASLQIDMTKCSVLLNNYTIQLDITWYNMIWNRRKEFVTKLHHHEQYYTVQCNTLQEYDTIILFNVV